MDELGEGGVNLRERLHFQMFTYFYISYFLGFFCKPIWLLNIRTLFLRPCIGVYWLCHFKSSDTTPVPSALGMRKVDELGEGGVNLRKRCSTQDSTRPGSHAMFIVSVFLFYVYWILSQYALQKYVFLRPNISVHYHFWIVPLDIPEPSALGM